MPYLKYDKVVLYLSSMLFSPVKISFLRNIFSERGGDFFEKKVLSCLLYVTF